MCSRDQDLTDYEDFVIAKKKSGVTKRQETGIGSVLVSFQRES